jgi:Tol biopolymer transport system component
MNCEQVEELLSAYLDNMLSSEERRLVASHLQSCSACSKILADYNYYDTLIALLPRLSPDAALRERLFTSPDLFEMPDDDPLSGEAPQEWTLPPITRLPTKHPRRDTPGRPQLIAIPGGRSTHNPDDSIRNTQPTPSTRISQQTTQPRHRTARVSRRSGRGLRVTIAALAAVLILSLGIGGFFGFTMLSHGLQTTSTQGITPPSGIQGSSPLSAGARYVFLRGNSLWSELADGSEKQPDLLTPSTVSVAQNWVVSNPLPGRSAGDRLAYIDLSGAKAHTIRSDGLQDITVNQPLLKAGINPASAWDTTTGEAILTSLAWSSDGNNLAFLADPTGSGRTSLYIYSTVTGKVMAVPSPIQGNVSHASWSPDGARLAFEVTQNNLTSIIDYNVSNHGVLVIAEHIGAGAGDGVLAMDWSPNPQTPAITWSVGVIGHVHSLWTRIIDGYSGANLLLSGDYAQAIYSRNGDNMTGSWLVISSNAGLVGDIWRIDVIPGSRFVQLTANRQVNFAQWSPDGSSIDYLDALSAGVGALYVVNATTGVDRLVASSVTDEPAPVWSADNQQIVFSTGSRVGISSILAGSTIHYLALKGAASDLTWSLTSPHQLIVAMNDGQQGIYLEDTQGNTSRLLDSQGTDGPLLWTQIP